jgi:hypothetical protein
MARIRTIKPDAFISHSLSYVPREVRWTFAGLWTYADDEGRARDDVRLIKAALYPLDDSVSLASLASDLDRLASEEVGCVCRYEVDGRAYLHMPTWKKHQVINRPTPSKIPPCGKAHEDSSVSDSGAIPEPSVKAHGGLTEGSRQEGKGKEQGKEQGTRKSAATSSDPLFDEFWTAYPRKTDKGHARKAWDKALKKTSARTLILAAAALAAARPDPKFTAHPTTWLNGERWDDQPLTLLAAGMKADGSRSEYASDDVRARFT